MIDLLNPRLILFVSYMFEEDLKKLSLKTKRRTGVKGSSNIDLFRSIDIQISLFSQPRVLFTNFGMFHVTRRVMPFKSSPGLKKNNVVYLCKSKRRSETCLIIT